MMILHFEEVRGPRGTMPRCVLAGPLPEASLSACHHQLRRVVVPPIRPELPGCRGSAGRAGHHRVVRNDSAVVRETLRKSATGTRAARDRQAGQLPRALRDVMPVVRHDTSQYANNRAEVSLQPLTVPFFMEMRPPEGVRLPRSVRSHRRSVW